MFDIGEVVVHPMHGAGVIDGIEQVKIDGVVRNYYLFRVSIGGLSMKIPVDNCAEIGLRTLITPAEADALLVKIETIEVDMTSNWNKRYRENMQRIKSGDLLEVASVIKGLMLRDREHSLSTGERKMLHSAKQIILSEIALALDLSFEEAETKLDACMT